MSDYRVQKLIFPGDDRYEVSRLVKRTSVGGCGTCTHWRTVATFTDEDEANEYANWKSRDEDWSFWLGRDAA